MKGQAMLEIGNYAIGANRFNIILYERRKKSWREIGFFSTPQNALEGLADLEIRKTELKDLKTVCDKISELHSMIQSLDLARLAVACNQGGIDEKTTKHTRKKELASRGTLK